MTPACEICMSRAVNRSASLALSTCSWNSSQLMVPEPSASACWKKSLSFVSVWWSFAPFACSNRDSTKTPVITFESEGAERDERAIEDTDARREDLHQRND